MKIIIMGAPIAKARPRFYRRGNIVGTYSQQTTEEGRWLFEAINQVLWKIEKEKPISLDCKFIFDIPKSISKKKRIGLVHTKRPDLDNLVKFVKDCLNGVAWHDDNQIVMLSATKEYDHTGEGARSIIVINQLG